MPSKMIAATLLLILGIIFVACNSSPTADAPLPTAENPPKILPAYGSIDQSVKDNVGAMGPRPTDGEIAQACQALRNAGWEYMALNPNTDGRSTIIAASITLFASGDQLSGYCQEKQGTGAGSVPDPNQDCDDFRTRFAGAIFELSPNVSRVVLPSFQIEPVGIVTGGAERRMQMDVTLTDPSGLEREATAYGILNTVECSWTSVLITRKENE